MCCAVASPVAAPACVCVSVLLLLFLGPQRNSVSDHRDVEGCAHMLLGNDSFSVPTQPADRQQDTIAATVRPHTALLLSGSAARASIRSLDRTGQAQKSCSSVAESNKFSCNKYEVIPSLCRVKCICGPHSGLMAGSHQSSSYD